MQLDEEGLARAFQGRDDLVGAVRNAAAGELEFFVCFGLGRIRWEGELLIEKLLGAGAVLQSREMFLKEDGIFRRELIYQFLG